MNCCNINIGAWVIDDDVSESCFARLGDARRLADAMGMQVAVLVIGSGPHGQELFHRGADYVFYCDRHSSLPTKVKTSGEILSRHRARVVFAAGNAAAREWASLLAAAQGWKLVSPALRTDWRAEKILTTRLDHTGRRSVQNLHDQDETVVLTMRSGVPEAVAADLSRTGEFHKIELSVAEASIIQSKVIPADPATVDIRYAPRLVAGGRGLGSKQGFDLLRKFAKTIGAGVAASRMAVDLGWIEHERQVGQTGKTVDPDLYVACGVSGASHHLQGMATAKHIIAINTDDTAPIFSVAHLGLVADFQSVLERTDQILNEEK